MLLLLYQVLVVGVVLSEAVCEPQQALLVRMVVNTCGHAAAIDNTKQQPGGAIRSRKTTSSNKDNRGFPGSIPRWGDRWIDLTGSGGGVWLLTRADDKTDRTLRSRSRRVLGSCRRSHPARGSSGSNDSAPTIEKKDKSNPIMTSSNVRPAHPRVRCMVGRVGFRCPFKPPSACGRTQQEQTTDQTSARQPLVERFIHDWRVWAPAVLTSSGSRGQEGGKVLNGLSAGQTNQHPQTRMLQKTDMKKEYWACRGGPAGGPGPVNMKKRRLVSLAAAREQVIVGARKRASTLRNCRWFWHRRCPT